MDTKKDQVILLAGPQGSGKTFLANRLVVRASDFMIAPGVVTRSTRGDQDGNDRQVSLLEFQRMRENLCLETTVGEHHYAYLRNGIASALSSGKRVIVSLLHAQDVLRANDLWPEALRVYLRPADWALLSRRLKDGRGCTDVEANQLLISGRRVVAELDDLDWDLRIDVAAATDSFSEAMGYLKASR